jgi:ribonuclease D
MSDIYIHKGDLPKDLSFEPSVAVDTETMGLVIPRDRLCTVQLSSGDGTAHIVQLGKSPFDCPNLRAVLVSPFIEKIFHFARFDLAALRFHLGVECNPVFCTKIASKLCRTYTDRHGLKDLCRELLGTNLSKEQQSSDWGAQDLSADQKSYAAADVLYLHDLRHKLSEMLIRENRLDLAQSCFRFLPHRATLDLQGWSDIDIFEH